MREQLHNCNEHVTPQVLVPSSSEISPWCENVGGNEDVKKTPQSPPQSDLSHYWALDRLTSLSPAGRTQLPAVCASYRRQRSIFSCERHNPLSSRRKQKYRRMKSTYSVTMLESEIRKLKKILPRLKSEQENVDMVSSKPIESKSKSWKECKTI